MISRNDPCFCGSGKKWKKCCYPALPPEDEASRYKKQYGIILKTPKQIAGIKKACQLTAYILDELCKAAKAGVTTNELDALAVKLMKKHKATAATLGYGHPPYPKSICTSLNEEICHGIPNDRPLQEGDIMNIDASAILDGYYGDCSRMVMIGKVSEEKKRVVQTAYDCLMESIKEVKPGALLYKIGDAIERVAKKNGCSVVYQFVGHGVGIDFHEAPQVYHHKNHSKIPLAPGMTFTIEPMINAGVPEAVIDQDNGWIARTEDGRASAQWEHTLLVTEKGCEILTYYNSSLK